MRNRTLTYYIGSSLDGYIAGPGDEYDALPIELDVSAAMNEERPETVPTAFRELAGLADAPNKAYDTVLMGGGTFRAGGNPSPYSHLRQYVFSSTLGPGGDGAVIVASDPVEFVRELKRQEGQGIWLCGGGKLAAALMSEIDEIIVKRYPVLFGGGIPMFAGNYDPTPFALVETRTFDSGAAIQTYRKA